MKESLDFSTRQLNECRLEVTSLKLELESLMARLASGSISTVVDEAVVVQVDLSQSVPESELKKEAEEDFHCVDDLNEPVASGKLQGREVQVLDLILHHGKLGGGKLTIPMTCGGFDFNCLIEN